MSWQALLVLAPIVLMVAYVLWTALATQSVRGRSVVMLETALPGLRTQRAKAVVYCFSNYCGPCRKLTPRIDRLRQEHANVFKLDVGRYPREARAVGVQATPTTLLVEDGKVLKALLGLGAIGAIEVFLARG